MTHRERFVRLFQGKPVDRVPFIDAMGVCNYRSCIERWKTEGLEANATQKDVQDIIGFDYARGYFIYAKLLFYPEFETVLLKREGDRTYTRNRWGGTELQQDGSELMPITLEGGVDIVFPWETQFGLDIKKVRQEYPAMGMMGGLNKHVLEFSREEMDKELEKVPYMLERGYYIPCLDHGVTNEVSWDNYRYFYEKLKEMIYKYPPQI